MATLIWAPEQWIVLQDVAWDTYERLLRDHANRSVPHFTFDRGTLEIMSPLPAHERLNRMLQLLLPVVAEATDSDLYSLGSTTFKREDLQRGFEGDSCFYVQNAELATLLDEGRLLTDIAWIRRVRLWTHTFTPATTGNKFSHEAAHRVLSLAPDPRE